MTLEILLYIQHDFYLVFNFVSKVMELCLLFKRCDALFVYIDVFCWELQHSIICITISLQDCTLLIAFFLASFERAQKTLGELSFQKTCIYLHNSFWSKASFNYALQSLNIHLIKAWLLFVLLNSLKPSESLFALVSCSIQEKYFLTNDLVFLFCLEMTLSEAKRQRPIRLTL